MLSTAFPSKNSIMKTKNRQFLIYCLIVIFTLVRYFPYLSQELRQPTCYNTSSLSQYTASPWPFFHRKFGGNLHLDILYVQFKTCAVVMSSGYLLNGSFGEEIDSHDCVLRFNDAPAGGHYARDVGQKTSIRVLGKDGFAKLLSRIEGTTFTKEDRTETFLIRTIHSVPRNVLKKHYPNSPIVQLNQKLPNILQSILKETIAAELGTLPKKIGVTTGSLFYSSF